MCVETDDVNVCLRIERQLERDVSACAQRLTHSEKESVRELSQTVCVENERETDKERLISVRRI